MGIPDPPLELCGKASRSGLWGGRELKCENPAHAHVRVFWRRWRGNERFPLAAALENAEQSPDLHPTSCSLRGRANGQVWKENNQTIFI